MNLEDFPEVPSHVRMIIWLGLEKHQEAWTNREQTEGDFCVYAETVCALHWYTTHDLLVVVSCFTLEQAHLWVALGAERSSLPGMESDDESRTHLRLCRSCLCSNLSLLGDYGLVGCCTNYLDNRPMCSTVCLSLYMTGLTNLLTSFVLCPLFFCCS